jgi:CsoR family transcriptional regulator, copper-sensing transcriptional repressor
MMAKEHDEVQVNREAIIKRLKRIEGQVRGLQKMVSEERECESIITQLAAVRSAIDGVGALVLNNYIAICAPQGKKSAPEVYESMVRVVGVWGRVRLGE